MDQLDKSEGLSPHDEIHRSDKKSSSGCTRISWKLGQSVESLHGEGVGDDDVEVGLLDHGHKGEDNNNADNKQGLLPRTGTSCVRFKDVDVDPDTKILSSSDPEKNDFVRRSSFGSKPKMSRQRMNTISNCQYYTIKETEMPDSPDLSAPKLNSRYNKNNNTLLNKKPRPDLSLNITQQTTNFPEIDNVTFTRIGSQTAPVENETRRTRTFSFGGGVEQSLQTKSQRKAFVSGDSGISESIQRRTFSFGANMKTPRRLGRHMTRSGDSATSSRSHHRSMNRMFSRGFSTTLTLNSVDGSTSTVLLEDWRPIFDKFDREVDGKQDGKIPLEKFIEILEEDPVWKESVPQPLKNKIIEEVDLNKDGVIDYNEFITLVKGKHLGLGSKRRKAFRQLLRETIDLLVPYKYTYQNEYSCLPPPLFMITVSLLQVIIFVFNSLQQIGGIKLNEPVPYCSHLIFNPNKRYEVWRYLTYSLVHSGFFHVTFNILVQLVLGIPLEMVHQAWRVAAVYLSGVLAGSLWTSVLNSVVFLSGASGGVYALITAHLGTVIMNHREMSHPWLRVGVVTLTAATDIGVYIYQTLLLGQPAKPVSYPAHIAGAVSGLLVGVLCLRNLSWEPHQRYIWVACLVLYLSLILVAVIWSWLIPVQPVDPNLLDILLNNCSVFIL